MKNIIAPTKKAILILLLFVIGLVISVVIYQSLKVVLSSRYHPDKMSLNYEISGYGNKNLFLIHGLTGSGNYWKRGLSPISAKYKFFMVDLLGFGDSPKPSSNYSLDIQIEALEKIILKERINDGKTILVGHSLGGIISLALLAKHPDWFEGAAVIGLPIFTNKAQFKKKMESNSRFDQLAVSSIGKFICMFHPLYMIKWLKPKNMPDDVFLDAKKHTWQSYYYSLNEIILKTDLYSVTKNIKNKKILFIQGKLDKTAPSDNVETFAKSFTNKRFISVVEGDHQLFLKDPEKSWSFISDFFKE